MGDGGTVQTSAFMAKETGECGDSLDIMGDGESAWQVGDQVWIFAIVECLLT